MKQKYHIAYPQLPVREVDKAASVIEKRKRDLMKKGVRISIGT